MRYLLNRHGHDVLEAESGARGPGRPAQEPPHLILLVIYLPGMDDYAVARALYRGSRLAELAELPIIAAPSYAKPGDRKKCLQAGLPGNNEEPITPPTFIAEVELSLAMPAKDPWPCRTS
jgi:CheY-like chemotaxis protein